MRTLETFANALQTAYNRLHEHEFKAGACMRPEDFSRDRKLDFVKTFLLILRGTKKSLQANINAFLQEIKLEQETYSKQAFSKGRQRIKPEAFLELFTVVTDNYYNTEEFRTLRGYRVTAIDGVYYSLPNTDELFEVYGALHHKLGALQVQAQGSCLYDVLNGVMMDVSLFPYAASERHIAELHLKALQKYKFEKELVLMDRGYPALDLFDSFNDKGFNFLIRCPKNGFIKEIQYLKSEDEMISHLYRPKGSKDKREISLRAITIKLENEDEEILLTNLFDKAFTVQDFKELYRLRWKIETRYDDIKNKLQIENFSGNTQIAIQQDFYATMFLTNMAAFAQIDCEKELSKKQKKADQIHEYKPNVSMLISTLKLDFIKMFLETSDRKQKKIFNRVMKQLRQYVVPIRPNRSYKRQHKHPSLKFPNNSKNL
jgi:hypothetical protein